MEPSMPLYPDRAALLKARELIQPYVHRTPVISSQSVNRLTGADLFFKCEPFQKAGAFKFRGAMHALLTLDPDEAARGVSTHSSGNHAQALSLAARTLGLKAYIVMPRNAPVVKVNAVRSYGGVITFCEPNLAAREEGLRQVIEDTGAVEIHPYNDYRIIAGAASAAAELLEDIPRADLLIAPVGGGGLFSGTILAARHFSPHTRLIGAEPLMANDAWKSFRQGRIIPSENPRTIADGLRTSLGSLTFPIIREGACDILTASEASIVSAMRLIWERMKVLAEPSAAVPLAVIMEHPEVFSGKTTGIILSGGNADLMKLPWQ
jgi:threonine dehydratase